MGLLGLLLGKKAKKGIDILLGSDNKKRKQQARDYKFQALKHGVEIERDSRLRIINESLSIMEKTKNLSTLNSRYELVCEHMKWMMQYSVPLNGETPLEAQSKVDDYKNENIVRVAINTVDDYKQKYNTLKTLKAKDNLTIKTFKILEECKSSLVNAKNMVLKRKEILILHNKIEDNHSNTRID